MNERHIKRFFLCGILAGVLCGCAETKNSKESFSQHTDADKRANATNEVLNPTAEQLHELSGELLAYIALKGHLPRRIEELQTPGNARLGRLLIDPATGQPFVYSPNSLKLDQLSGRVVVYQNSSNRAGQRWVLLINDQTSDGRVVMYVQTITEAQWKASFSGL